MAYKKRLLIVGGVAGGASCAARARRLSEQTEIIVFDRGSHVSFANCGLPYYVGNVIRNETRLLMATPELFSKRFNIQVRLKTEVLAIDREKNEIIVKDRTTQEVYHEKYDALVLSPGAAPIKPSIPGIDLPGVFSLRTIPDSRRIREWISKFNAERAVVVGGGFIGLEMAENLVRRGISVTIVEMQPQVMPNLDPEIASPIHGELIGHGVSLRLGQTVTGFEQGKGKSLSVMLGPHQIEQADVVILSIGVRPEVDLAIAAGLEIGQLGGIRVDDGMRTSDERIWAVGDAVEVRDVITGRWMLLPLAGPANRQGRIAADVIMGKESRFRGAQATAVLGVFDLVVASTGITEKALKRMGLWDASPNYEKIYLHPDQHASYYPGTTSISLKLIFSREDGRVVGAQAVGKEGVEKRIDIISMAIQRNSTVFDLEEAELCYSPQFGSAKDPINLAGMIAANALRGDAILAHSDSFETDKIFLLDVRDPREFDRNHIEGAVNIPLNELRSRMNELPKDREIWTLCYVGQRSYYAGRALMQYGFNVKNISGGIKTYNQRELP